MLSILQSLSVKNCPLKMAMTPSLRNTFGWNPDTLDSRSDQPLKHTASCQPGCLSVLGAALPLCTCVLSHFSCNQHFATLRTVAHQTILSMGFSRQECQSQLPYLFWGIFPTRDRTLVSGISCIGRCDSLPPAPPGHPTLPSQLFKFPHSPQTMDKGILSF